MPLEKIVLDKVESLEEGGRKEGNRYIEEEGGSKSDDI